MTIIDDVYWNDEDDKRAPVVLYGRACGWVGEQYECVSVEHYFFIISILVGNNRIYLYGNDDDDNMNCLLVMRQSIHDRDQEVCCLSPQHCQRDTMRAEY